MIRDICWQPSRSIFENLLFQGPGDAIGFRVIQEVTLPSPVHIIYKVLDLRLWKDTEDFPPLTPDQQEVPVLNV
jgi:hypothetical protein